MFQNIQEETNNQTKEETNVKRNILTNAISKKYILLYIITFMVSTIGLGQVVSPFSLAIIIACASNEIPIIAMLVIALVGNIVGCGVGSILPYILTMLVFFASFFVVEAKYNDESRNEKVKLGARLFTASLIIGMLKVIVSGFLLYDILVTVSTSILVLILYKVFTNSISVIVDFTEKRAFTLEEVIGTGILIVIAACSLGNFAVFGFSIRNIIAVFVVLVLGWKNGMLVGTTAGATIGVTVGIILGCDPIIIAVYTVSGLIAGILNKFGKIGVILGFIIGTILLTYFANGGMENLIMFQEILIAGIGLLFIPKNIEIDIENILGDNKFLPVGAIRGLNKSRETAEKLKDVSKVVKDMADNYATKEKNEEKIEDGINSNKQAFITELLNYTDNMEDNILYENISKVDGPIVNEIFNMLLKKQFIKESDLLKILAQNDIYVVGFDEDEKEVNRDVEKMTHAINSAYRIGKMNFIWSERLKEEKKNAKVQLQGVSEAISEIAENIKNDSQSNDLYSDEKDRISLLLKQKEILVQEISINKQDDGRFLVEMYVEETGSDKVKEIIKIILERTLNEKIKLTEEKLIKDEKCEKYVFASDDKFILEIGQAIAIKDKMSVSGDSMLQLKLKDGKYLLAISDGMGSGPDARKSSQIVIKLLQRLLNSGFKKETSIDLINSNLLNVGEDVFATLDVAIIDLYNGTVEFIKSGCSPTYIKNRKKVQIIKSISLPTGAIKNADQEIFDKDIENGDIIVMCSDGIVDSNIEYRNKELWVKYLLEDMENEDSQKMADIILNESIDNTFGKVKDDMSILVCKLTHK